MAYVVVAPGGVMAMGLGMRRNQFDFVDAGRVPGELLKAWVDDGVVKKVRDLPADLSKRVGIPGATFGAPPRHRRPDGTLGGPVIEIDPAAWRLAVRHGIGLAKMKGSAQDGSITLSDVQQAVRKKYLDDEKPE